MSFLLKDTIHQTLAETLYNEILSERSNYYYYVGRVVPWSNESTPETPQATGEYEYVTRNGIISIKKISVNEVSFVIPRRDWVSGTVYDQFDQNYSANVAAYSGAQKLQNATFYVLNSEYNVYKCLFNNNNAQSTTQPTGTSPVPRTYSDGYIWKYMYSIPVSLRNKFLTATYMPVQKQVTNKFYSNGQIESIVIDDRGSGYSNNSNVRLVVYGTFNGGSGNVIANLTPVLNANGQFISVKIDNPGNNYATANIAIIDSSYSATGYYNTSAKANIYPVLYNGRVDRVLIDDPGIGYSSNLQTVITYIGDGSGAVLTPYVNSAGEVEDIIIESRGSGYTYLDINIVGDGSNANAYVNFSTGDLDTVQSTVELSAVNGSIEAFRVHNSGNNYTYANVLVTGDGSGFIGNVVLDSNTNTISYIEVVDSGSGYTHANVTITGDGSNANVSAIISPYGGHGLNPVKELFADTLMLYSTINNEKNQGISVSNDYRQFGIVKDIKKFGTNEVFTGATGSGCYLVTLDSTTNLTRDANLVVVGNTTKEFEVMEIADDQVVLINKNNYTLSTTDSLYDASTDTTYAVNSIDANPDINKFTGEILYIDNRTSVSYSDQQLVTLRTVIQL